jgi:hypothetical protein
MTDEMLALARDNAADAGATNVEFLKGTSRGRQREQAAHHRDEIGPDHVRRREDVREVIV